MCALLPAWLCLVLSLLLLEIQSWDSTLQSLTHGHRLSLSRTSKYPKLSYTTTTPTVSDLPVAVDNYVTMGQKHIIWRALLQKEPPPRLSDSCFDQNESVLQKVPVWHLRSRGRRHASSGRGRRYGHLMRVRCVLGTCQVQNLSQRLYQLVGQSRRRESSPINPHSPHSYG